MAAQRLSGIACRLLALTGSTALNVWEPAGPTYYTDTELPGNPDSCCGSQLIGDPTYGVDSKICDCDLTAGVCDAKCCCDQDCSEYETMTVFACASNATHSARAGVKMCSDDLVHTNLPRSAVAAGWETETDLDGILCVVHDNSASSGAFYTDPTAKGGALSQEEVRAELDRYGVASYDECVVGSDAYCEQGASGIPYTGAEGHYSYAQPVLGDGCLSAGSTAGCDVKRPALLPAPAPDGKCGGRQQRLGFLVDVPPFSCRLELSAATLPQLCATRLNASFVAQQLLAATPSAAAAIAPAIWVQLGPRDPSLPPNFTDVTAPPASVYDAQSAVCHNALIGLEYALFVTGSQGALKTASAYLSIDALSLSSAAPTLQYGAAFRDADGANQGRALSGKPGYMRGLPVLVADRAAGSSTLQLRRRGLQLLGIGPKGECDSSATTGATLLFGEELDASCSTTLSYEQLSSFCDGSLAPAAIAALQALQLDWEGDTAALHFGAYGDAHPGAADDWVGVTLKLPPLGLSMSYSDGECANVLAGIHVRVLVADVGARVMPVRKIIGATIELTTQTVVARRCALGLPCDTKVVTRATSEVVSVPADGRTFDYVPPTPTIIPALPDDVFYPFTGFGVSSPAATSPRRAGAIAPLGLLASLSTGALLLTALRSR